MMIDNFFAELISDPIKQMELASFYREFVINRYSKYGRGHMILAFYASFPSLMTPDLLYRMWQNFGQYWDQNKAQQIHRVAVSDLLLSPLFKENRNEEFEMQPQIRQALSLHHHRITRTVPIIDPHNKDHPLFGQRITKENPHGLFPVEHVALFLLGYLKEHQQYFDSYFYEQQWLTAQAYLDPRITIDFLARKLDQSSSDQEKLQYTRYTKEVGRRFGEDLVSNPALVPKDFNKLLRYANAERNLLFEEDEKAIQAYRSIFREGGISEIPVPESGVDVISLIVNGAVAEKVVVENVDETFTSEDNTPTHKHIPAGTIYAILVGINSYDGPGVPTLSGCINDVLIVNDYFERLCASQEDNKSGWKPLLFLSPKDREETQLLMDKNINYRPPTRQNIVEAFKHFQEASSKRGDICLFYFSGYGSTKTIPKEFSEKGSIENSRTIVCSDSRKEGHLDLFDQEIGFLISEALEGNTSEDGQHGVHCLTILDCGYYRSGTRDLSDTTGKGLEKNLTKIEVKDLLRHQLISSSDKPMVGQVERINLSGARTTDQAQERTFGHFLNNPRARFGVFTFSLITTLEQSGVNLAYSDLIRRIELMVRNKVDRQVPELEWINTKDQSMIFMRNQFKNPDRIFPIVFRPTSTSGEWYLQAGSLHGIALEGTQVRILDNSERFAGITEVRIVDTKLNPNDFTAVDRNHSLLGRISSFSYTKIRLRFHESFTDERRREFLNSWENIQPRFINIIADGEIADYEMKLREVPNNTGMYFLITRLNSEIPLFFPTESQSIFIRNLDQMARWEIILNMSQPSDIPRTDIAVEMQILEGVNFNAQTFSEIANREWDRHVTNHDHVALAYVNGQQPAIKIKIKNHSGNEYYVGALFLDSKFGISSEYLPPTRLNAGLESVSATFGKGEFGAIPLQVDDAYLDLGVTDIRAYFIVYARKSYFNLADYNQTPIALTATRQAIESPFKNLRFDKLLTIKIPISLTRPIKTTSIAGGASARVANIQIQYPKGFSSSLQPTNRAAAIRLYQRLNKAGSFDSNILLPPISLLSGAEEIRESAFSNTPASSPDHHISILELTETRGQINEENPIIITLDDPIPESDKIIPLGYNLTRRNYFRLGRMDEKGRIVITQLPLPTPGVIKGSGVEIHTETKQFSGSVKVFFKRYKGGPIIGTLAEGISYGISSSFTDVGETSSKQSFRLAFFGTPNQQGEELYESLKPLAASLGFLVERLNIDSPNEYTAACANYDAVVLDASLHAGEPHNYRFAMPNPAYHILVVSRTQMPLNFYGTGDSFPITEPDGRTRLLHNSPLLLNAKELSNKELCAWLIVRLKELREILVENPEVIEDHRNFFRRPLRNLTKRLYFSKEPSELWFLDAQARKQGGKIFIDFRNYPETYDRDGRPKTYTADKVYRLKTLIENGQFPGIEKKIVRFFPPNSLSNELMSEQRRWQLLSIIDRYISIAEEFWIYESENYYNSWWTLGNLLTLSYRRSGSYRGTIPKIRIFRPDDSIPEGGRLIDVDNDFLPAMTEKQKKRMARWYANSDPVEMAPESVLAIRAIPEMPLVGWFFRRRKYFRDHVWSSEFWENPLLDCPACRKIGKNKNRFDIDSILWHRGAWFSRFTIDEMQEAVTGNGIQCPNCRTRYNVKLGEPNYLWIPPLRRELVAKYYLMIFSFEEELLEGKDLSVIKLPVFESGPVWR